MLVDVDLKVRAASNPPNPIVARFTISVDASVDRDLFTRCDCLLFRSFVDCFVARHFDPVNHLTGTGRVFG